MSQENVELVRAVYARWTEGSFAEIEWADPDIELVMHTPGGGTSRGTDGMLDAWRDFLGAWEEFEVTPVQFLSAGADVLVLNQFGGRGRQSGLSIEGMRGASLFTFEGGRAVRLVLFTDWDEALDAAGLSE
jgi:uncharacterized protein